MFKKHMLLRVSSAFLFMCVVLAMAVPSVLADDINNTKGFRKHVTVEGIGEHLDAFQAISDANGGTRAAGTPGFNASVDYIVERTTAAGYNVTVQEFVFPFTGDNSPPVLNRITAPAVTFVNGIDYASMSYSGSGDSTASVYAVDLNIGGAVLDSGCQASDFAGFPAGSIALVRRGGCTFRLKADNAQAAGAAGIIIFNTTPGTGVINGTLGTPGVSIPVVGASYAVGDNLRNGVTASGATGVTARLKVDAAVENRVAYNVIAETPGGDPSRVVVVGAHLDSVTRGGGINDNGSGSATILEVAEVFAAQEREPRNKLRFMWYGAEEFGLLGSRYYVNNLPQAERDNILMMLNFDMIASPNYVRFVYDGDNSSIPVGPGAAAGPAGSGYIESMFNTYFASQGLASAPTAFSGRSDYGPFIEVGIPAGGLFTGAEGVKTAAQAEVYGGTAGVAYDQCYHLACDTIENINWQGLDEMSDAVAHVVLYFSKFKGELPATTTAAAPAGVAPASDEPFDEGPHPQHDHDHDEVSE